MFIRPILAFLLSSLTWSAFAETYVSTGLYYLNGQTNLTDQTPVQSWSTPVTLSTYQQDWQFSLSTSLNRVTTDENQAQQTSQGLGDTYIRVGHTWADEKYLTAALIYKLATGNADEGLSSGADDIGLQIELLQPIKQASSLFGHLGYSLNGEVTGFDTQNTASASIGFGHQFNPIWFAAVSSSYQQSLYPSLDDQVSIETILSSQLTPRVSMNFFSSYDNTQTMSVGLSISRRL